MTNLRAIGYALLAAIGCVLMLGATGSRHGDSIGIRRVMGYPAMYASVDSVYHLLVVDTMTVLTPTGPRRIGIISFPEEGAK